MVDGIQAQQTVVGPVIVSGVGTVWGTGIATFLFFFSAGFQLLRQQAEDSHTIWSATKTFPLATIGVMNLLPANWSRPLSAWLEL
jgi:hypothetical protein